MWKAKQAIICADSRAEARDLVLPTILIHLMFNVSANLTDVSLRPISTAVLSAAAIIVAAVEGPQNLSRKPAAVAGV